MGISMCCKFGTLLQSYTKLRAIKPDLSSSGRVEFQLPAFKPHSYYYDHQMDSGVDQLSSSALLGALGIMAPWSAPWLSSE